MFRKLIATTPTWITVPVRIGLGLVFIGHGAQKVLGAFGGFDGKGGGLSQFMAGSAPLGLRPAGLWLGAAAVSELIGGILVFLGLLTRLGAALIACVMLVAIIGVHWPNFFAPKGMEEPLALLAMALALIIAGGGQVSIDQMLIHGRR